MKTHGANIASLAMFWMLLKKKEKKRAMFWMVGGHMYSHSPVPTPPSLSLTQTPVADGKKTHTYLNQTPKQTVENFLLKRDVKSYLS